MLAVREVLIEELRVEDEVRVGLEEVNRQRLRVAGLGDVLLDPVYGEEAHPLLALLVVGGDLFVQLLRHAVQGEAVFGGYDELLLKEPLLEVLDLGEERGDAPAHALHGPHHLEPALGAVRSPAIQVVHVQHLVLEVEVQLPSRKPLSSL